MVGVTLNAAIIDDEPLCIEQLKQMLQGFDYVHVTGELNSSAGLMNLLQTVPVDLLFLDIKIQQESGFTIAEYINRQFPEKMLVFTTGFEGLAVNGYEYEPLDFLTKPVNELRLEKTLARALSRKSRLAPRSNARVGLHTGSGLRIVEVGRILYIEKVGRKVQLVYGDPAQPERILLRSSLTEMARIFENYGFFRIHQSFLVPLQNVCGLLSGGVRNTYEVELAGVKEMLPLSRDKYPQLRALLEEENIQFIS